MSKTDRPSYNNTSRDSQENKMQEYKMINLKKNNSNRNGLYDNMDLTSIEI